MPKYHLNVAQEDMGATAELVQVVRLYPFQNFYDRLREFIRLARQTADEMEAYMEAYPSYSKLNVLEAIEAGLIKIPPKEEIKDENRPTID